MPERNVADVLKSAVTAVGGDWRKVSWEGRRSAPDLLILLPGAHPLVETKAPLDGPTEAQAREHARLRAAGFQVYVINSRADIERFMEEQWLYARAKLPAAQQATFAKWALPTPSPKTERRLRKHRRGRGDPFGGDRDVRDIGPLL